MKAPIQGHESREFNRMYKEVDELYHEVALKSGLSDTSFLVLFSIVELGDGCLQIDIANRYFISKQTISSSVRALEQKGYLYLKHGKKRDMNLYLTAEGERFAADYIIPLMELESNVFLLMSPEERDGLLRLTRRYTELLKEKNKSAAFPSVVPFPHNLPAPSSPQKQNSIPASPRQENCSHTAFLLPVTGSTLHNRPEDFPRIP